MITLTRRQIRRLRGVFRRSNLGISNRGPLPPLVLSTGGSQLRIEHQYKFLAVEYVEHGAYGPHEGVALPIDALRELEGRDDSAVTLEAASPELTIVRFQDHAIPQVREYAVPWPDALTVFPTAPTVWSTNPPELLAALAEVSETTCADAKRYALNCIQFQGDAGEIVGSDGQQLLTQGGFRFPWSGNIMVYRAPILGCRDLPHDQPVAIGRTDTHVVLSAGNWTLFLEINTEGRFPSVTDVFPDSHAAVARLHLDSDDAAFLASALDRLPGTETLHAPATIDLNGAVTVRAQNPDLTQTTDLVLARSSYSGTPIRISSDRAYLSRAIRLGFTEFDLLGADAPVVCRAENRVYGWQALSNESAIAPAADAVRVESSLTTPHRASRPEAQPRGESAVNRRTASGTPPTETIDDAPHDAADAPKQQSVTQGPTTSESASPSSLSALIQEGEALLSTLAELRLRTRRLVVGLRRHKKQGRLMASTLAALKQLKLQEVAD